MPLPNPSHRGNTGRPPSSDELREGNEATGSASPARSYGQSAELPDGELAEGETAAPARPVARGRVEDEHDTIEDLADEPMLENSDTDAGNGRTRGEHLEDDADVEADSELLEALGDAPLGAEDDEP